MAVLNITNQFIDAHLSRSPKELIFTKDKHIVTHGVDFLADYKSHTRGLIPNYDLGDEKGVFGHNGWAKITAEMLPILTDLNNATDNTTIPTSNAVKLYLSSFVQSEINAAQRMQFKGIIGISAGKIYHKPVGSETTVEGMPTTASVGDTYLVGESGTLAEETVQAGDMIICKQAYSEQTSGTNTKSYWFVIQRNLDLKTTTLTIGNQTASVFSNTDQSFTIYNPKDAGTTGQILVSKGNTTPEWQSLGLTIDSNGTISHTIGSTGTATISALSSGLGLYFSDNATSYNGGVARTINLAKATKTTLGGVIVGDNITLGDGSTEYTKPDGTKTTPAIGTIYLTKDDVIGALGYTPTDPTGIAKQRDIQVAGTTLGNSTTINFMTVPNSSIGIIATDVDPNTSVYDIGFDIFWYNLDTGEYEI